MFLSECFFCAHRANKRNEGDRLSSMITRWLNHDLECSWKKLATAVKEMQETHAGPGVAKKLLQSIGLESGTCAFRFCLLCGTD